MTQKITEPQARLLHQINEGKKRVNQSYPPASVLVRKGLAYWQHPHLTITDAGRKFIGSME